MLVIIAFSRQQTEGLRCGTSPDRRSDLPTERRGRRNAGSKRPTVHVNSGAACRASVYPALVAVNAELSVWTVPTGRRSQSQRKRNEENWPVCGAVMNPRRYIFVVLGSILDLEQVDNADEASLDAQPAKHVKAARSS